MKGSSEMVGKILKSKINGEKFIVDELFTEPSTQRQYYNIKHIASGNISCWGKEWFEKGLMQNLEEIKN